MAFAGMNMAGAAGGLNAQDLFAMGQAQQTAKTAGQQQAANAAGSAGSWTCKCGTVNIGKFCNECGSPKPISEEWTCSCGAVNKGKFCSECGSPKPAGEWTCNCGTVNKGKFCSECGSPRK